MFNAEKCRHFAEECEQAASEADFRGYHEDMLLFARLWRELAVEREKANRTPTLH